MSYQLRNEDLIRVESAQPRRFMDRLYGVATVPLAEAVKSPNLFDAFIGGAKGGLKIETGQQVTLYRFTDESPDRLAEMAQVVIVEVFPHAVDFKVIGNIVQMPVAPENLDDLVVVEVPGEFRAVSDDPDSKSVEVWRVETRSKGLRGHPWVTMSAQHTQEEAEKQAAWQRKASPDYVVTNKAGDGVSPRYNTRKEAEAFKAQEIGRRKAAVKARADARKPKIHAYL
jgi:hypothetical protein